MRIRPMEARWRAWAWVIAATSMLAPVGPVAADDLDQELRQRIRPALDRFCGQCHSSEEPEADVDLQRFGSIDEARRGVATWRKVAVVLDKGDMPPPEARQPSPDDRRAIRDWVHRFLDLEAKRSAGDPGRVLLRRLSNAEYTRTIRDLTGVPLDPAREFPQDGAAGEGFTNTGDALVMSPAMLGKYLDAARQVAARAVPLPDGFRFSRSDSRRDWTNEVIADIRHTYDRFADRDGKIPLESYLDATIRLRQDREARPVRSDEVRAMAESRGLSPKYLATLWEALAEEASDVGPLGEVRARWRAARPDYVGAIARQIRQWQSALWRFNNVGAAFDRDWQEPVTAMAGSRTLRREIPGTAEGEVVFYLSAGEAGDGPEGDVVAWRRPRFEAPGRPPLLLRDVRGLSRYLAARRRSMLDEAVKYLGAVAEAPDGCDRPTIEKLARSHGVAADALAAWLDYLGLAGEAPARIEGYLADKLTRGGGHESVSAWRDGDLPSLLANASDQEVHIPGLVRPHGISVHPSPGRSVAIGWRSPIAGRVRIVPTVADAHAGCGNGVAWSLELRRGGLRRRLASGAFNDGGKATIPPVEPLPIQPGDLVSMIVGPRDGNHGCDTTEVDLEIIADEARRWRLAADVSGDLLAGNPHADRLGHRDVWHFYSEPVGDRSFQPVVPAGSVLARWLVAKSPGEKSRLADKVAKLLTAAASPAGSKEDPDARLYRQARSLDGPLLAPLAAAWDGRLDPSTSGDDWGLDPSRFADEGLTVRAPSLLTIRLPADLVAGRTFVVDGELEGAEGSVQLDLAGAPPGPLDRLRPGVPIVAREGSRARARLVASLDGFRRVFPAGLCFRQIVPVDEVVTMIQFFRADEPFARLMLVDVEKARLDRLWDELHYISQDGTRVYQTFDQMLGFASQEGQTAKVEAWRKPITAAYEAAVKVQAASEPEHLRALLEFAARAHRRPLSDREKGDLRALYRKLRSEDLPHDEAFRLVMVRVLVSPEFLYRIERPGPGVETRPVSDWELASRLSYFLWASMPDAELTRLAADGRLKDPDVLAAQARRMVRDPKVRGLATEFACQWIEVRDFDAHDEKSDRHFLTFAQIRPDLYEEAVRSFVDTFARDGSILEWIDADHTFLNESLARHYGIEGVTGPEFRRVDGVRARGRGGVLALGAVLSKQSGASRTSPVLRGNWLLETLLGDRLPRPPKNVPQLPDDEATTDGLTVRQLVEKHRSAAACAGCHARIDPFGFALEAYDPIGRLRRDDLGGRPVDTRAELKDGTRFAGIDGLKDYLLTHRREDFRRQFCRKLLGYALGRSVQLSDEPMIAEMLRRLDAEGNRFSAALEVIVRSRPFRDHRGRDGDG